MKIKNGIIYFKLHQRGKKGWGDLFEKFVKELGETLEQKISDGKKLDAKLVKEVSEKIQSESLKIHLNNSFLKDALTLLEKAWEYGDEIEKIFPSGKI